jgi:hypothetical protein
VRFCGILKKPTGMKKMLCRQNSAAVSPSFLLDVSAGNFQRALVDGPGKIKISDGDAQ